MIAIKVTLLISCALAATTLLRTRSAALRHRVLAAAIVCATMTPVLELMVPSWSLALGSTPQFSDAFVAIWMAGAALSLFLLLVGCARVAWLASRARRVESGRWTERAEAISLEYGLSRPVLLLQTNHPTLLVTWGLVRPKVLLPGAARDWTDDRVRAVLAHELAHVQRGDWVVHLAAELLRSVYWFNPLVWVACRRLRQESEHACDDAVLSLGVDGAEYATHLVEIARAFHRYRRLRVLEVSAPAMARASSLERRITAALSTGLNRAPVSRFGGIAAATALLALTVPVAGFGTAPATGSNRAVVSRGWPTVRLKADTTGGRPGPYRFRQS